MVKRLLITALLLSAAPAFADEPAPAASVIDTDGFTEPLKELKFNPGLDQREFERSTLNALEVYDPLESWNRRVYTSTTASTNGCSCRWSTATATSPHSSCAVA